MPLKTTAKLKELRKTVQYAEIYFFLSIANGMSLNIHFKFDNLFNENKFTTKS